MKHFIFFLCVSYLAFSQSAIHNAGNFKIHEEGQLGLHIDLINSTGMDNNLGMVGFYGDDILQINGAHPPQFHRVELANSEGLELNNSLKISNRFSFYYGNVFTPYGNSDISLHFLENAVYEGVSNQNKVLGYAGSDSPNFELPIGDEDRIRSISGSLPENMFNFRAAYYNEDPNETGIADTPFDTEAVDNPIMRIGMLEFWDITGDKATNISLSWDENSQIAMLTENSLNRLFIAGWHTEKQVWENLGNIAATGNMDSGTITSLPLVPDTYSAFTFGGVGNILGLGNYLLTPNGDGANERFKLRGVESANVNSLKIYNRWGRIVYEKDNYFDEFEGYANVPGISTKDSRLPAGIYVYTYTLHNLNQIHQGFLYLNH
ncbi:MAG: gliding motility-associated C-terminal domain-containing protein [Flavobacteriaceae bacterium]|nr:gliding motility-associated C-terminal domain-containing protein [Flavobacteriaceae bacterium]